MATVNFTSLLGLALPTSGDLEGTWGDEVNDKITTLLDFAIAGSTALSTDADVTLTATTGAANQARQAILLCTGARTGLQTVTAPAASKTYVVINATTGGHGVKVVGVGPTTGVTIPAGDLALVTWNGSDFAVVGVTVSATQTLLNKTISLTANTVTGTGAEFDTACSDQNFVFESDIGTTVQAYDADTAKTDVTQTFTVPQRGTVTTDNDLSFNLNATNNFTCTPTAGGTLTFTDITAGQSGFIKLVNGSNYAIAAHANTKVTSTFLATVSATGTYIISYYSDGTNVFCATAGAMA